MAHYVAGIDAAASGLKVCVLDASLRGLEVKRLDTHPWRLEEITQVTPDVGAEDVTAATPLVEAPKQSSETILARQVAQLSLNAEVHMAWDGAKSATRILSFPLTDMRKIESMIDFELEDQLARGLDEIVYTRVPVALTKDKTDLLIATTERESVKDFIDAANALGKAPRSLLLESFALFAVAGELRSGVIVDIGHTKTHVLIVADGKPIFSRTLREGGRRVDQALARILKCDEAQAREAKEKGAVFLPHEEAQTPGEHDVSTGIQQGLKALVTGLRQTLLPYLSRLGEAPTMCITGGMAYLHGIDRYLTSELGCDTTLLALPKALTTVPDGHRYTMAYAVALTGTLAARHPRIDFRVGELSFRGDLSGLRNEGQRWAIGVAIVIALAFTAGITRYVVLRQDEKKLDESLKQVTKAMMGREMTDFKQAMAAIKQSVNPEKSALPKFSALDYFGIVSQRIPADLDVKMTEIELRQDRILMKGDGASFEVIEKATEALKGHECFKAVVQPGKTRKSLDGQRYEFQLQIDLACGNG